jgi:hypothetical protein
MPIEEDEMRRAAAVDLLVDAIEELHGGLQTTLAERIERLDGHAHDGFTGFAPFTAPFFRAVAASSIVS